MEHLTIPVQWKAAAADARGSLTGYASTYDVDLGGDLVVPGAFCEAVAKINGGETLPLLADHVMTTGSVIGSIFRAAENDHGLVIEARFASTQKAQDVRSLLKEGHLDSLSIGYQSEDEDWTDIDGREVRLLKRVKLWEVSVVVTPMNPHALVGSTKAAEYRRRVGVAELDRRIAWESALLRLVDEEAALLRLALRGRR